jgi:hypothetical protein
VSGVSAIHDALRNVDTATSNVAVGIDVRNPIDRAGMNAHSQLNLGIVAQSPAQLQCAANRSFGIAKENKCHAVPSWEAYKFFASLGTHKFRRLTHRIL